jgi:ATP adenylyltransferase
VEALWAPWRMEYIKQAKDGACIFCPLVDVTNAPHDLILWRGQSVFCLLNRYPYNPGHLMVAPYDHVDAIAELPASTQQELIWLLGEANALLERVLTPAGLNCGLNLGRTAGAGVLGHLHFHSVPRWEGDTNFFPVLSGTRSLPEYLDETYQKLLPAFSQLQGG